MSLLQCAEDIADLSIDLGQLLVDRRQIHVLLLLGNHTSNRAPQGKAKSKQKAGSGPPSPRGPSPSPTRADGGARLERAQCGCGGDPGGIRRAQIEEGRSRARCGRRRRWSPTAPAGGTPPLLGLFVWFCFRFTEDLPRWIHIVSF